MTEPDTNTWRERGRRVGHQLLERLDAMALEDAIRALGSGNVYPKTYRHAELSRAYQNSLRDALRDYYRAAGDTE